MKIAILALIALAGTSVAVPAEENTAGVEGNRLETRCGRRLGWCPNS